MMNALLPAHLQNRDNHGRTRLLRFISRRVGQDRVARKTGFPVQTVAARQAVAVETGQRAFTRQQFLASAAWVNSLNQINQSRRVSGYFRQLSGGRAKVQFDRREQELGHSKLVIFAGGMGF